MSPVATPSTAALGCLISDLRTSLGWSQSRLATELGHTSGHDAITREQVSRWENPWKSRQPVTCPHCNGSGQK